MSDANANDSGAMDNSNAPSTTVLDFPQPVAGEVEVHVNHGLFWASNVDLGTSFFWDAYVAPRTPGYLVSDGYGGGHAMLWGPVLSADNQQLLFQGNIWNGQQPVDYTATEGPAPGEWGYHAIGMAKDMFSDNVFVYTYWNGITVGITAFGSLTRHSRDLASGNGVLYVMGSNHQNLSGRIAALRVWDRSSPFAATTNPATAFIPERAFSAQNSYASVDFLADYTLPAISIPDLSPAGYAGGGTGAPSRHPGRIFNAAQGASDSTFSPSLTTIGPLATWVRDSGCPYGLAGQLPPNANEIIPPESPVPPKALVFDSFGRRAQNFLWQQTPTLGKTEGGILGVLDWMSGIVGTTTTVPSPWGIINGRAVYLESQPGIAWVDVGTADQDVRIKRFTSATPTGIAFRVQDRQNFWYAFMPTQVNLTAPVSIRVGYFQNGTAHDTASYLPPDNQWLTLRVQAIGTTVTVYRDDLPTGSLQNAIQLQTATGAGMTGTTSTALASSFWRGDDFTVCDANGC